MNRLEHDWYPAPLPENVRAGERSWIYSSFAFLHCRSRREIRIGHDTGLYNGTFLNLRPHATVEIGNYCTLVGAIIDTDGPVTIGDYSFLAHEVVLADSDFAVPTPARDGTAVSGPPDERRARAIRIGSDVWIGARACVIGPVTIGDGAVIGAGAVVVDDVPPYAVAAGNPARVVSRIRGDRSR